MNNSRILPIFLAFAVAIRFLLMIFSFHGDLAFIWAIPSTVQAGGVFNFYKDFSQKYPDFYKSVSTVYYPPLALVLVVFTLPFLRLFSPSLQQWLLDLQQMLALGQASSGRELYINSVHPGILLDLWLLKLPYFILDIAAGWLIWKICGGKIRHKMLILWWFNPINLYATYMMGQIDIAIVFLLLVSVFLFKRHRAVAAVAVLAASMIKTYAVVLTPVFFIVRQSFKQLIFLAATVALVAFFSLLPFVKIDSNSIVAAFFPKIMASPISCEFRPDSIWSCGKILIGVIVLCFGLGLMLINKLQIEKKIFIDLTTGWLALFYFTYRGLLINHYLVLVPFLGLFWIKAGQMYKFIIFNLLVFASFIYVRPLLGELLIPTGIGKFIAAPDLRELVSPWVRYENVAFLARILLDLLLLEVVIDSFKKSLVKQYGR